MKELLYSVVANNYHREESQHCFTSLSESPLGFASRYSFSEHTCRVLYLIRARRPYKKVGKMTNWIGEKMKTEEITRLAANIVEEYELTPGEIKMLSGELAGLHQWMMIEEILEKRMV